MLRRNLPASRLYQPYPYGEPNCACSLMHFQLLHNMSAVRVCGLHTNAENRRYLFGGLALSNQGQDLSFAGRQHRSVSDFEAVLRRLRGIDGHTARAAIPRGAFIGDESGCVAVIRIGWPETRFPKSRPANLTEDDDRI